LPVVVVCLFVLFLTFPLLTVKCWLLFVFFKNKYEINHQTNNKIKPTELHKKEEIKKEEFKLRLEM
jgi:hypothetical protein